MKKILKKSLVLAVGVGIASLAFQAHATNGYFSHGYGIKSKGMGGVGVALPQDSITAAINPAGMVLIGNRWDVGAELFVPDREAVTAWGSANNATSTTYDGNGSGFGEEYFLIPEFGYNQMIGNNMSIGVSVFGNGGMNTSYSSTIFSAQTGGTNTGIDLSQLFIAPTLSIKLDDKNSIGVSMNLVYQRFKAEGLSDFCGLTEPTGGPAGCSDGVGTGLSDQGSDDSIGIGFRFGWIGQLTDTVSAGFSFQPRTNMQPFTKYNQLFAEGGDFDIPANYAMGVSWLPTSKLTLAMDVMQIKYSQVNAIANPNTFVPFLGADNGPGFGWDDMTVYKLGASYQVNSGLVLRAGYNRGDQPISQGQTLFNVIAPAVVQDHLTLGFTMNMKSGGEWSGYFMHALKETVNGNPGGAATGANSNSPGAADISMSQTAIGVAYGKSF